MAILSFFRKGSVPSFSSRTHPSSTACLQYAAYLCLSIATLRNYQSIYIYSEHPRLLVAVGFQKTDHDLIRNDAFAVQTAEPKLIFVLFDSADQLILQVKLRTETPDERRRDRLLTASYRIGQRDREFRRKIGIKPQHDAFRFFRRRPLNADPFAVFSHPVRLPAVYLCSDIAQNPVCYIA